MIHIYESPQTAGIGQDALSHLEEQRVPEPAVPADPVTPPQEQDGFRLEGIGRHQWSPSSDFLVTLARRGAGVEQFRRLRSRMSGLRDDAPLKTIVVSSGLPEEGKTFVAANLAMSLGRNGNKNILLIDGDLRRPKLHELLGAPPAPGLSEYLAGMADLTEIMQRDVRSKPPGTTGAGGISALTFIPAGKCGDNSSELVANRRIEHLIAALSPHFDWILIDASPVLVVTDAVDLARSADAVVLVARAGITRFGEVQRAQAAFGSSRILGVVLNAVRGKANRDYYYNYHRKEHAEV